MMPEGIDRTEQVSDAGVSDAEGRTRVDATRRALPLIAVVGRPNVGKSTLFNRLTGERRSIVGDEPGITRDRIYGESEWNGRRFALVDTGGIVPDDDAVIPSNILKQAAAAIEDAAALLWVVDVRKGVTPLDEELARLLRLTGKRVLVAANKADAERLETEAGEFHRFGFAEVFPVSAEHGNGLGDLLDSLTEGLEEFAEVEESEGAAREIRLAIIGRPNVGK
ncbi:MAG TPA: GTPase, partial [Pyrinomonadaceae bacterium]|nr:GTPase [Pyrinomonadaceae bacterium]